MPDPAVKTQWQPILCIRYGTIFARFSEKTYSEFSLYFNGLVVNVFLRIIFQLAYSCEFLEALGDSTNSFGANNRDKYRQSHNEDDRIVRLISIVAVFHPVDMFVSLEHQVLFS